ncbi:MAG: OmpA family protein [Brevinematales bacterium]|nr:OmpA family protein [Brevinematales bacterium]
MSVVIRVVFIITLFLMFSFSSYPFILSYKLSTNNIYRLKVYTRQDIYIDGLFFRTVEAMSKITMQPYGYRKYNGEDYIVVKYMFYYLTKKQSVDVEYRLSRVDEVDYLINEVGNMIVLSDSYLPPRRSIPSFVRSPIAKGMKWQSVGEDIITERDEIVRIKSVVNYSIDDIVMKNGRNIAIFNADYGFMFNNPAGKYVKDINFKSSTKYNWDVLEGIFSEYREIFDITKTYLPGYSYNSTRHQGSSVGIMEVVPINIAKQYKLAREIEKLGSDVSVSPPEDNEIKVSISDILFDVGSFSIKPSYRDMIVNLANILKQYNEVDVVVEGHTDDRGTRDFNITLSENRAKAVANILIQSGIKSDRVSYRGYGPDKPILPNTTDENRAKNRRVEIKLIWGK